MMTSCLLVVTVVQFGNLAFLETSKKLPKMVGAAAGRKLGWLMPFVAIGWLWAHGIVGSAGHAHGWGPRPGGGNTAAG